MLEVLTDEEIDCVFGGMGNGGGCFRTPPPKTMQE